MAHRILSKLTVGHHGVPIGRTSLLELEAPRRTARVPAALRSMVSPSPSFAVDGFEPLPGYDSVRAVVQRATLAAQKLGYLGPVEDPESDRLGREALEARQALIAELECHDQEGQLVPVEFILFEDGEIRGEPYIAFLGTIDDAAAGVLAYLRAWRVSETGHEPPGAYEY